MATHSSVLAWRIPGAGEPGGLPTLGSHRVGSVDSIHNHNSLFTPVFLPGESQGWGSLVGCRLWGCTELATTEET